MLSDFLEHSYLCHWGILGMKWGIRRYQNPDGSLTEAGRQRYGSGKKVFVSGSSKTQTKDSRYYSKKLPKEISKSIDELMKNGDTVLVGDAPGIDRQVQDYLKKNKYDRVTVYGTGDNVRYSANKKWDTKLVDPNGNEPGTPEFNRQKDIQMAKDADSGIGVVLEEGGAGATRDNIVRLLEQNKDVKAFELNGYGKLTVKEIAAEQIKKEREASKLNLEKAKAVTKSLDKMKDMESPADNIERYVKDKEYKKEWDKIADLGLNVMTYNTDTSPLSKGEKINDSHREWFLLEDQTIGYPEVTAMYKKGYTTKQIRNIVSNAKEVERYDPMYRDYDMDGNKFARSLMFCADEGYGLDGYIDALDSYTKKKRP